jgi:hypothetical protein
MRGFIYEAIRRWNMEAHLYTNWEYDMEIVFERIMDNIEKERLE